MSNLQGKYAIVTGGCKGIGAASVKRLIEDGAAGVAILEWDFEQAKNTAAQIDSSGEKAVAISCDVSNEEQVAEAVKIALEKFKTIDILVNNAGITKDAMFHKMSNDAWDAVLKVNLYGTYYLCKYVVPVMREKCYGKIVNIASVSAYGLAGQANYSASKGAIISLTKTLAKEGGPKNITANCIAPGFINTDMYKAVPEEIIKEHIKLIPQRRLAEPEEIASIVSFLASDDSSWISGQCIIASGGSM